MGEEVVFALGELGSGCFDVGVYAVNDIFSALHITNLVWSVLPYFLSMFLLGMKGGMVVSAVYIVGIVLAVFTRFVSNDPSIGPVYEASITLANVFAFTTAPIMKKRVLTTIRNCCAKTVKLNYVPPRRLDRPFNRRFFDRALHQPLSLILMDIDFFKNFNDELGHLLGDACLGDVAEVIRASITRSTDTATRYSGDEFAVLLPNTDLKGASTVAQCIRSGMEELAIPHILSTVSSSFTLSMGIALLSLEEDREPTDLIRRADRALYISKAEERDRVTSA